MIRSRITFRLFHSSTVIRSSNKNIKDLLDNAATGADEFPSDPADMWSTKPYPKGSVTYRKRDQGRKVSQLRSDPKETSIILFPGQGAQYVGMAKDLEKIPEARDLFDIASQVLRYDLLKLCNEGPAEKLNQTRFSQPAIAVTSLASLEKITERHPNAVKDCMGTAGFSLGEITALIFAGAISFDKGEKNYAQIQILYFLFTYNIHFKVSNSYKFVRKRCKLPVKKTHRVWRQSSTDPTLTWARLVFMQKSGA